MLESQCNRMNGSNSGAPEALATSSTQRAMTDSPAQSKRHQRQCELYYPVTPAAEIRRLIGLLSCVRSAVASGATSARVLSGPEIRDGAPAVQERGSPPRGRVHWCSRAPSRPRIPRCRAWWHWPAHHEPSGEGPPAGDHEHQRPDPAIVVRSTAATRRSRCSGPRVELRQALLQTYQGRGR